MIGNPVAGMQTGPRQTWRVRYIIAFLLGVGGLVLCALGYTRASDYLAGPPTLDDAPSDVLIVRVQAPSETSGSTAFAFAATHKALDGIEWVIFDVPSDYGGVRGATLRFSATLGQSSHWYCRPGTAVVYSAPLDTYARVGAGVTIIAASTNTSDYNAEVKLGHPASGRQGATVAYKIGDASTRGVTCVREVQPWKHLERGYVLVDPSDIRLSQDDNELWTNLRISESLAVPVDWESVGEPAVYESTQLESANGSISSNKSDDSLTPQQSNWKLGANHLYVDPEAQRASERRAWLGAVSLGAGSGLLTASLGPVLAARSDRERAFQREGASVRRRAKRPPALRGASRSTGRARRR